MIINFVLHSSREISLFMIWTYINFGKKQKGRKSIDEQSKIIWRVPVALVLKKNKFKKQLRQNINKKFHFFEIVLLPLLVYWKITLCHCLKTSKILLAPPLEIFLAIVHFCSFCVWGLFFELCYITHLISSESSKICTANGQVAKKHESDADRNIY